jgi:hypothetical protein
METVTVVATALVAGAAAGVSGVTATAVADAYAGLKSLVTGCFSRGGVVEERAHALIDRAGADATAREALEKGLAEVELDESTVQAAQRLLDLLESQQTMKFQVDASQAKGIIVGDHATQHNTFN